MEEHVDEVVGLGLCAQAVPEATSSDSDAYHVDEFRHGEGSGADGISTVCPQL